MRLFLKALVKKMETTAFLRSLCAFILLSGLLTPAACGQKNGTSSKGMSGSGSGSGLPGPSYSADSAESPIADAAKAAAFRERCLLLTTKFNHKGVDFQSKSGIGCIISTPKGQRILAMPLSMIKPADVVQNKERLSISCSMLLATKLGTTDQVSQVLASFTERVEEFPIETKRKQPLKKTLMESERLIHEALDKRGDVSFNHTPLSGVMKYFRDTFGVPIVIDDKALEADNITVDEPITLELPTVSFRSALRLVLNPLDLTFVIENEVLKITGKRDAEKTGTDPINHWSPVGPELASERKIFQTLDERGDVNFNATPLSGVIKVFRDTYGIPILIDDKAMEEFNITPEEPITLELPTVSFRSALNLIFEPLDLTYVIENEVLLITSKARALIEHPAPFFNANPKGVTAQSTGMGGGMRGGGGGGVTWFNRLAISQRYNSFQEAQKSDPTLLAAPDLQRREFAAIHGPLATSVDLELGVAFVSLPGDFQSVPIPARVDTAGKRFVMLGQGWTEINKEQDNLATVINGSPVVDQRGDPVGMIVDQKVVTLPELVQSLLTIDSMYLGYWGTESQEDVPEQDPFSANDPFGGPVSNHSSEELPALVTKEIKKQIEFMRLLSGKEKEAEIESIQIEFDKRVQLRRSVADEKLKSVQSKLERLTELSQRMNKKDLEEVAKHLQGNPPRKDNQRNPPSQGNSEEDPFK